MRQRDRVRLVSGDISSDEALAAVVEGCDAVIYNVGIIREIPAEGVTFEATQYDGVVRTVDAAKEAGVKRLLLMSANGVKSRERRTRRPSYGPKSTRCKATSTLPYCGRR